GTRVLGQGRKEASRLRMVLPGVVVLYIISRNPSESVKNPIMLNRIKTVFEPGVDPRTRIQTQTTLARLQLDLIDVYVKYAVEYAKSSDHATHRALRTYVDLAGLAKPVFDIVINRALVEMEGSNVPTAAEEDEVHR